MTPERPDSRPWFRSYPAGVPRSVQSSDQTLSDLLDASVAAYGDRVATDFFGRETTYAQLGDQVARAAGGLDALGVRAGDRVSVILPTVPENVVAFYAVARLAAVCVEENPALAPDELASHLRDYGSEVAIVARELAATVASFIGRPGVALRRVVAVDSFRGLPADVAHDVTGPWRGAAPADADGTEPALAIIGWDGLLSHPALPASHPRPRPGATALIQYTSGTTGSPKGAVITHANQRTNALQLEKWYPDFTPGHEVFFTFLPFSHVYGIMVVMVMGVSVGARIVLLPRMSMVDAAAAMRRAPATFLPGVPPIYDALSRSAEHGAIDLHGIKYAMSGAMPLTAPTVERWVAATGGVIIEGYGMTEVSGASLFTPVDAQWRPGTVGVPLPGTDARIVDPDSLAPVPLGEAGELLVRGPQVFQGYWNRPEETAEVLLPDGWLRTGDLAKMGTDGYVTIVGRLKELIITGGLNVSPTEVERVLAAAPGVAEAVVVPRPKAVGGEGVAAGVVIAAGAAFDPQAIRAFVRDHLAAYETPKHIVALPALPRTPVGKILRSEAARQVNALIDAA